MALPFVTSLLHVEIPRAPDLATSGRGCSRVGKGVELEEAVGAGDIHRLLDRESRPSPGRPCRPPRDLWAPQRLLPPIPPPWVPWPPPPCASSYAETGDNHDAAYSTYDGFVPYLPLFLLPTGGSLVSLYVRFLI